jgi:hypothetical protein
LAQEVLQRPLAAARLFPQSPQHLGTGNRAVATLRKGAQIGAFGEVDNHRHLSARSRGCQALPHFRINDCGLRCVSVQEKNAGHSDNHDK